MKRVLLFALFVATAASPLHAHELIARNEAKLLSETDRQAAAKAEADALDQDKAIKRFEWKGPDGASGLIIISGMYPDYYGMGRCRNFVHLIRHPNDGGVNPTFEGTVCRNWEGKWLVEKRQ